MFHIALETRDFRIVVNVQNVRIKFFYVLLHYLDRFQEPHRFMRFYITMKRMKKKTKNENFEF